MPINVVDTAVPEKLWEHASPTSTPMWRFLQLINTKHGLRLDSYEDLYEWSLDNIATFWAEVWSYTGVRALHPYTSVVDENAPMFPRPPWFSGAKLNFAENLLFPTVEVRDDELAIIEATETSRKTVSWKQLRERVRFCRAGLVDLGIKEGDRIAGYVANHTNALVAMLASTAIGAVWTAVSPDTGVHAVLERLQQIEPTVLFADNASFYSGKAHPVLPKVKEIAGSLPSLAAVVIFETVESVPTDLTDIKAVTKNALTYTAFTSLSSSPGDLLFKQLDPDHPVYILYSSGTTGAPKCIVHGAIGTLLQHKKEHVLHCSLGPGHRLFYYTTCTWMMWHWLVSGLASGSTLILYDGSPFRYLSSSSSADSVPQSMPDDLAMPRLIQELRITHFGTSAKYLSLLEQKSLIPKDSLDLTSLQAIYSTGSPLSPSTFKYIYAAFPATINLGSITGGTDIISLFGAPSPLSPVHAGEIQVRGLGMAVRVFSPSGTDITVSGTEGDLVCTLPFPSQPTTFYGPCGAEKYRAAYFTHFPPNPKTAKPVWHHGDFVQLNRRTAGLTMLGRSDGVLKPQGVRFGSAEIYNLLLRHFPTQIVDALCVGRRRPGDTDEQVLLFLLLGPSGPSPGEARAENGVRRAGSPGETAAQPEQHAGRTAARPLAAELERDVRATIRRELSARHVPAVVAACPDIPVTQNGKKVETVVKAIVSGREAGVGATVANPACLAWFREWARGN